MYRSLAASASYAAESDDAAYCRRVGSGRRQPEHRVRCSTHKLVTASSSKRFVDSDLSSRRSKNHSRKREFAGSVIQQRRDYGTRSCDAVSRSSSLRKGARRRRSWWSISAPRPRHAIARDVRHVPLIADNDDDDDYITTSSDDDDHPSTSTSSFAPPNCVDDRASLLSSTTTSSSAVFVAPSPRRPCHRSLRQHTEPSVKRLTRRFHPSSISFKSAGSSRSLTTSNDDNDLDRSKSLEEIAVASRCSTEAVAGQFREDELRAVKSLFEFRSSDELRMANNFIDGAWNLCSRRSLYNERYMCSKPASLTSVSPTSLFRLYYNHPEKDLRSSRDCDDGKIITNDDRQSNFNDSTGSERFLMTGQNNEDVIDDDRGNCGLNVADVIVRCDGVDNIDDWNGSNKEFRSLEMIPELNNVIATTSDEDDLKICICKSPKTCNNIPNSTQGRDVEDLDVVHRIPQPKLVKTVRSKQLEHAPVSDAMSQRQTAPLAVGEKSSGLSTLLSDWLANRHGVKMLTDAVDSNSKFAAQLVQVFDALLVRSGVGETASVAADIKMFHGLTDVANDCIANKRPDASKLLRADADNNAVAATLAEPTGNEFISLANNVEPGKQAGIDENRCGQKRERACDILWKLTPRLSVRRDQTHDTASSRSTDLMSRNIKRANCELSSPRQSDCYDNGCMTATTSTQTNDFNDDPQSTAETRIRMSRKSRGRGKVKELIKLFESASASTLNSGASPVDVKRAAISAAVSVGELLRRASEQEVTSCCQHACSLPDVNATQPRISSPKLTSTISNAVSQAPRLFIDECISKPEVHKSTARWPTMSRIRRQHYRRRDKPTSSKTGNSRSDARTTPADDNNDNLPRVDDTKTLEAVWLSSKEGKKLANDDSSEYPNASITQSTSSSLRTGRSEASGCEVTTVASKSNLPSPIVVGGLPKVVDSVSSLSPVARQENVYQLPSSSSSSSSSSSRPLKSLHTCEAAVTANTFTPSAGGSGDVGGCHEEGGPASSDGIKQSAAQFNDEVYPSTNYAAHSRPTFLPSVGLSRKQPAPTSAVVTRNKSTEPSSCNVATNGDCQRFTAQSWFMAGGPCLVEVPRWSLATGKDVATVNRGKSTAGCPAKATLGTETSCPAAYAVLRQTGVTVYLPTKNHVNNGHLNEEKTETGSVEYTADSHSRRSEARPRTQSAKNQSCSYDVQAVKHQSSRTVTKLATKNDEHLSRMSASWRPTGETVCGAATTKTTKLDQRFDVTASPGAVFCGRGHETTLGVPGNNDRLQQDEACKSVNRILSTDRRTTNAVTIAADPCPRYVESHTPSDEPSSKRSSSGRQFDTTSRARTSSIIAKCGLVSGESIQSPDGVTVVYSRRRSTSERPSAVTVTTPSQGSDETHPRATDRRKRLAQQFLLTSVLEYRLDSQRK